MPPQIIRAEPITCRYQREAVMTTTPAARFKMLYDQLVLELRTADQGFERRDLETVEDRLCRAQVMLQELRGTPGSDPRDGATNLSQLYDALHRELVEANLHKNRGQAQRALAVITQLAEVWWRVADQEAVRPVAGAVA